MIFAAAVCSAPGTKNECWGLRSILSLDRRTIAESGALFSTQRVKLSRALLRERKQQKAEHENPDRALVLYGGMLGVEVVQVLRLFSVDQALFLAIHIERARP